ncbi:MAG: hypothetical protein KDA85_22400, partial [Planctomycetaceae bacterium]|nr:hypothetical protein [Planctomycetaceae bacterium]
MILLVLVASNTPINADTVQLPVTQDNSIVMVAGEWSENAGGNSRIRIKGNQHNVAMNFDVTAILGKRIKRAELVCHASAESISGVTISTIATPWEEHQSNGLTAGRDDFPDWGYPGARFPAVTGGNGFTLVHQAESAIHDGAYRWEIPPDMIYALAVGAAQGLAVHEHDADYGRNPTIYSREQSGKQPYLLVETVEQAVDIPEPPRDLRLVPVNGENARLILQAPSTGFAYEVSVDDQPLPRHNIPMVV